jgi:hypothetical protein
MKHASEQVLQADPSLSYLIIQSLVSMYHPRKNVTPMAVAVVASLFRLSTSDAHTQILVIISSFFLFEVAVDNPPSTKRILLDISHPWNKSYTQYACIKP